jgi:outer membrane receptor protein involved in Fe transport
MESSDICSNWLFGVGGDMDITEATEFTNDGSSTTQGFEIGLQARPTTKTLFRAAYSQAWTEGEYLDHLNYHLKYSGQSPNQYDDFETSIPLHTYSLLLSQQLPWQIDASLAYYYVDEMKWNGDGDVIEAHETFDARLSKTQHLGGADAKLALLLRNINSEYQDFREENKAEQEAYLEFSLHFH